MIATIIRRFTTFADYPRFEYILKIAGVLNNLYLGTTLQQARESMAELNNARKAKGLPEISAEFFQSAPLPGGLTPNGD